MVQYQCDLKPSEDISGTKESQFYCSLPLWPCTGTAWSRKTDFFPQVPKGRGVGTMAAKGSRREVRELQCIHIGRNYCDFCISQETLETEVFITLLTYNFELGVSRHLFVGQNHLATEKS